MGVAEGNPVMRWAMDGFGIAALAAVKLLVVGGAMCLRTARVTERSSHSGGTPVGGDRVR